MSAEQICNAGRLLSARGLTPGTSGNISVRVDDGYLMSPTNMSLAELRPDEVSRLDARGEHVSGNAPTKERDLHLALYERRPEARAIVHVHSTYAVALACLEHADPSNVLLPLTPYALMRVGRLALVPYAKPGTSKLAAGVAALGDRYGALLLANHGPIVAAATLAAAVAAIEEIEEAAKVQLLVADRRARLLSDADVAELLP